MVRTLPLCYLAKAHMHPHSRRTWVRPSCRFIPAVLVLLRLRGRTSEASAHLPIRRGFGLGSGDGSREVSPQPSSKRVSFHAVTGPSRHSRGLPVVLSRCITLTDGAFRTPSLSRLTNILHLSDPPSSPPSSPTFLASTEMVAPAGLEPARIRPHRAAPSCRRTPTLTERNGTTQPPATCVPPHRVHSAERNAIGQRPRSTDAVLTGRRPTSPALTRDSHPLGTRICCARLCPFGRTLNPLPKKQGKSSVFLHGALCGARHQGVAPDKKKDKGYERDLRKRCGLRDHNAYPNTGVGRRFGQGDFPSGFPLDLRVKETRARLTACTGTKEQHRVLT